MGIVRQSRHLERGVTERVLDSAAAIQRLANHVQPRHGRPVQEVATPQKLITRAGTAFVLHHHCLRLESSAGAVPSFVAIALVRIEIAVVLEGRLEGVVDHAIAVDVLVVGVNGGKQRVVTRRGQHHHRTTRSLADVGRVGRDRRRRETRRGRSGLGPGGGGARERHQRSKCEAGPVDFHVSAFRPQGPGNRIEAPPRCRLGNRSLWR